uniref:IMD domain-containing protein n=1 Tax=Haemonchus contortus TaxID=6289 RepID=A0A7I4Z030_HAECO
MRWCWECLPEPNDPERTKSLAEELNQRLREVFHMSEEFGSNCFVLQLRFSTMYKCADSSSSFSWMLLRS